MYQIFIALLFSNNLDGSEGTKLLKVTSNTRAIVL